MKITLNGQTIHTHETTLGRLLTEQGYTDCNVATALDGNFVPKDERTAMRIEDGCKIDVVAPMQGG